MLWYNHTFVQMCLLIGTVSQVSDVAHGSPVLLLAWLQICTFCMAKYMYFTVDL